MYHLYVESRKNGPDELTCKAEIVTDVENKLGVTRGRWAKLGNWDTHVYTTIYKIGN